MIYFNGKKVLQIKCAKAKRDIYSWQKMNNSDLQEAVRNGYISKSSITYYKSEEYEDGKDKYGNIIWNKRSVKVDDTNYKIIKKNIYYRYGSEELYPTNSYPYSAAYHPSASNFEIFKKKTTDTGYVRRLCIKKDGKTTEVWRRINTISCSGGKYESWHLLPVLHFNWVLYIKVYSDYPPPPDVEISAYSFMDKNRNRRSYSAYLTNRGDKEHQLADCSVRENSPEYTLDWKPNISCSSISCSPGPNARSGNAYIW